MKKYIELITIVLLCSQPYYINAQDKSVEKLVTCIEINHTFNPKNTYITIDHEYA